MGNLFRLIKIMKILKTKFKNLLLIKLDKMSDFRGNFSRLFCDKIFTDFGVKFKIKQVSLAKNPKKFTLRGMHFQDYPKREQKLLFCLKGKIWDVVVDVRKDSSTFGQWQHFELNNKHCLFIPKGFAHGFLGLKKENIVLYSCSNYRDIKSEQTVRWNDKDLKISWGIKKPILSRKDRNAQTLSQFLNK